MKSVKLRGWQRLSTGLFAFCIFVSANAQETGTGFDPGGSGRTGRTRDAGSSYGGRGRSEDRTRDRDVRTDRDSQRDSQRRDSSRARNSNSPGTRAQTTPTPAGGKATQTVKGKPAAPAKGAASSSGGTARATTNVEFKMKADPSTNLLLIETDQRTPTMNINVVEGGTVVTKTVFRNARHSEFRSVDVSIKYDPELLQPVGLDDTTIDPLLATPALAKVENRRGIIAYHAEFKEPQTADTLVLFKVKWKALEPASHTSIALMNTPDYPSRVMKGEVNVLVQRDDNADLEVSENTGLLNADIAILPSRETAEAMEDNEELSGVSLAHSISQGSAEGGITLALRPRKGNVGVGEDFLVDIVFNNPRRADIDLIKLKIRFDPKVLQVVDYDTDNWITRGVNIFDGAYHEELPFDHHMRNEAYNTSGQIQYKMGFGEKVRVPSSGVVATIRFEAIAPTAGTDVAFQLEEEDERDAETAFTFLGFNLIGTPGNRLSAITNAQVAVSQ